jgi:hypothetical protein
VRLVFGVDVEKVEGKFQSRDNVEETLRDEIACIQLYVEDTQYDIVGVDVTTEGVVLSKSDTGLIVRLLKGEYGALRNITKGSTSATRLRERIARLLSTLGSPVEPEVEVEMTEA